VNVVGLWLFLVVGITVTTVSSAWFWLPVWLLHILPVLLLRLYLVVFYERPI